jgi:hypothetical protein
LEGRALAQTAVTMDASVITGPAIVTGVSAATAPEGYALLQNFPNPFNPSTTISYSLAKSGDVSLKVYNVLGGEVATLVNGPQDAGSYSIPFNTTEGQRGLATGVYFYRLQTGSFVAMKKLVLVK